MLFRASLLLASGLLGLLAVALPCPASTVEEDWGLEDWNEGPARYIMTGPEAKRYRSLTDETARREFIERFWRLRDPDPRTGDNQYRISFWSRVLEANRRFTDSSTPGWKTDRGKIFILLGEPDEVAEHSEFDSRKTDLAARGLIRWFYRNLPVSRSLDPETVVAFVRDNTGDWRLTTDPELNDLYFDPLRPYDRAGLSALSSLHDRLPLTARSELATALELGRLQAIPSEEEALRDLVLTREFFGTLPAEVLLHRLPAGGGDVFVTLTLVLDRRDLEPPFRGDPADLEERFRIAGRLFDESGGEILLGEPDFRADPDPDPADPMLRFQARVSLAPGRYRLSLAAFDLEGDRAATVRRDERIPAFDPRAPAVSDLILASRLRPVASPQRIGWAEPFVLGDLEVVPRGERPLSTGDRLRVYFQVHRGEGSSAPARLEYRFARRAPGTATFEAVGTPRSLADGVGVQTWDLPLEGFPPGRYRVTVEVASEGTPVRRSLEFDVEG